MKSITDELREWFKDRMFMGNGWQEIHDIADHIDANFKAACESEYAAGVMSVPIAVDESKWVKLPLDADGVPIRIGDVMAYEDNTKPKEVVALVPPSVFMVEDGPRLADSCRHYHAPTVEDVLDEFASAYDRIGGEDDEHQKYLNLIAEYAAKLRLAGDE